jgi:hypothetical protein
MGEYPKKINLEGQVRYQEHRSGWGFALDALAPLHKDDGTLFHGYLEKPFSWDLRANLTKRILPYKQPWCGFLHGGQNHPIWFSYKSSTAHIVHQPTWMKSMSSCKGIFVLSNYSANYLRRALPKTVKVSALIHPTEIPDLQFSWDNWLANKTKRVLQLGWYLRRLDSIYRLPVSHIEKIHMTTGTGHAANMFKYEAKINARLNKTQPYFGITKKMGHVCNEEYDQLLSQNIGFVHLYEASANNAVIECIARTTPLLINPLPAVKEYLGDDYPLYFKDLQHAAKLCQDEGALKAAHQHMKDNPVREKLTADHFLKTFAESEVYEGL